MAEKSARRALLESSLAEDPSDRFLRYGLAVQCLREGAVTEGRDRLLALIADHPDDQVASHQMLGQSYAETEEFDRARVILDAGIALATRRGDWHAAGEMEGLRSTIG